MLTVFFQYVSSSFDRQAMTKSPIWKLRSCLH